MALPLILVGAAAAAAGYGAKKGYDGYQDKTEANRIFKRAKERYESSKKNFDAVNEKTTEQLETLGNLQLQVGQDFNTFKTLATELLNELNKSEKDITFTVPKHRLNQIENLALSTTTYLAKVAGAGVAGVGAAYAVYGGVMALAAASTGTPIAALSGAAAYNATMAAIGGGSLAAGGFGMAGGAMVLGTVVAAPILAIAGWAFASHAEEALDKARETRAEVDEAVSKLSSAQQQLNKVYTTVKDLYNEISRIYKYFSEYLLQLTTINELVENGVDIETFSEEVVITVGNGYKIAAILADIISTPLFKVQTNRAGTPLLNEDNTPVFATDTNGMQILNEEEINSKLSEFKYSSENDLLRKEI